MDITRYTSLFLAEAEERLQQAGIELEALESGKKAGAVRALFRHLHSLKGMAATMGFTDMVQLSHAMEDLLDQARSQETKETVSGEILGLIQSGLSYLRRIVSAIQKDGNAVSPDAATLAALISERLKGNGAIPRVTSPGTCPAATTSPILTETQDVSQSRYMIDLRLKAESVDSAAVVVRLVNKLGTLGRIHRIHPLLPGFDGGHADRTLHFEMETTYDEESIRSTLAATGAIDQCEIQVAEPPPTSRRPSTGGSRYVRVRSDLLDLLMENSLDLALAQENLAASVPVNPSPELFRQVEKCQSLMKEQYSALIELRLVPFESVANRIHAGVESLASSIGKEIKFSIEGRMIRLDRSLLEAMVDPLLHIVRNAIDHGIESPDHRVRIGKEPTGKVVMELTRSAGTVKIVVEDDGRGLDPDLLRSTAVERRFLTPQQASDMTDEEICRMVTLPAFSTSKEVSSLSGRGVGLDVVVEQVESLGGRLEIHSETGRGTRFILELPQTMAIIQGLLVRCADRLFALPITSIRKTFGMEEITVSARNGKLFVQSDEWPEPRPACPIIDLLSPPAQQTVDLQTTGVALLSSTSGTVLLADEVIGRRDLLVRPLEPPLRALRQLTGAALLQDGSVALVLDPDLSHDGLPPRS